MESQDRLLKITARLILSTLIILVMVVGKSFLVPFTWSLLIALASLNFVEWIHHKTKIPFSLIVLGYLLLILASIVLLGYFMYFELHRIFSDLPTLLMNISDKLHALSVSFANLGIPIPDHIDKTYITDWVHQHHEFLTGFVSAFGMNIWNIVLVMFYLFFILYYKELLPRFLSAHVRDKRKLATVRNRIKKSLTVTRSYIYGLMLITIISAAMNFVVFLIFGLKFALFFAVFLALLNLIPFIGNPIGLAVIIIFAIITKDNMMVPLLIFVSLFAVNFIQDNVIRPWLIGDKLEMNAFTVFVAIIIGGMIWGVSGMILFIPLVGILKIFIEGDEANRNYAIFFAEVQKNSKRKTKPDTAKNIEI